MDDVTRGAKIRELAKGTPEGMAAYLCFRGYSVAEAEAAFEAYRSNGFWRSAAGDQFGEPKAQASPAAPAVNPAVDEPTDLEESTTPL